MLFEPQCGLFEPPGLHSHESLVTVQKNGCVLVPVQNPDGATVQLDKGLDVGVVQCVSEFCDVVSYSGVDSYEGVEVSEGVCDGNLIGGNGVVDEESNGCEKMEDPSECEKVAGASCACGCVRSVEQTPERSAKL